jgi:hypothetical protein
MSGRILWQDCLLGLGTLGALTSSRLSRVDPRWMYVAALLTLGTIVTISSAYLLGPRSEDQG